MKPVCETCEATQSVIWHKGSNGTIFCNDCFSKPKQTSPIIATPIVNSEENSVENSETALSQNENSVEKGTISSSSATVRKSNRMKSSRYRSSNVSKMLTTKGRSRRQIFKRNPVKSATEVATVHASEHIFYNGTYWQVGDIASVVDEDDGKIYYCQIRGFLQDQFNNKSAVLSWLLPTSSSSSDSRFDPTTYVIGPEEDIGRKMEYLQFVCHAPSDYYKLRTAPYIVDDQIDVGYIVTPLGYQPVFNPSKDDLYFPDSDDEQRTSFEDFKEKTVAEPKESVIKAKVKSSRLNTAAIKNIGRPKLEKK